MKTKTKAKTKTLKKVYIVFKSQNSFGDYQVVKVFAKKQDADDYCDQLNDKNEPEFDDYGHCDGVLHDYYLMKVE